MSGGTRAVEACRLAARRVLTGRKRGAHFADTSRTPPWLRIVWYATAALVVAVAIPLARPLARTTENVVTSALETATSSPDPVGTEEVTGEAPTTTVSPPATTTSPTSVVTSMPLEHSSTNTASAEATGNALAPGTSACPDGQGLTTADLSAGDLRARDLAEALVGDGVRVSDATFVGAVGAAGIFTCGLEGTGLDSGVVLSTGAVGDVAGPNLEAGTGTDNDQSGDESLASLSGQPTLDAAVLELDVIADLSTVTFDYVFASEEFAGAATDDPADVLSLSVNGVDCAVVPGTDDAVGSATLGDTPYVRSNPAAPGGGPLDTGMDGLTTVLSCPASAEAGATNEIRLAIADTAEPTVDSAVFLGAHSLRAIDNQAPVAQDDQLATRSNVAGQLDVLANDTDDDDDLLSVVSSTPATSGTASCDPGGVCRYLSDPGFVGTDSFTYTIADGRAGTDMATVAVTVSRATTANNPPSNAPGAGVPPSNAPPSNAPPSNAPPSNAPPSNAPPSNAPPSNAPPPASDQAPAAPEVATPATDSSPAGPAEAPVPVGEVGSEAHPPTGPSSGGSGIDTMAPGFPFLDDFPGFDAPAGRTATRPAPTGGALAAAGGAPFDGDAFGAGLDADASALGSLSSGSGQQPVLGPLVLDRSATAPGGQAVATGQGCDPGGAVAVTAGEIPVGTAVAGADGAFSARLAMTNVGIGRHEVVARCDGATLRSPIDIVSVTSTNATRSSTAAVGLSLLVLVGLLVARLPGINASPGSPPRWRNPLPRLIRAPVPAGARRSP